MKRVQDEDIGPGGDIWQGIALDTWISHVNGKNLRVLTDEECSG